MVKRLGSELGLTRDEAVLYLSLLSKGSVPSSPKDPRLEKLEYEGMLILSGDGKRFIPVHPRLAVANHYRSWRERMVREINERRMRVDRLILELIPVYEAAMEKKAGEGGG